MIEDFTTIHFALLTFVFILVLLLLRSFKSIKHLKEALVDERKKRETPILLIEIDEDSNTVLYNDSFCYAKNIRIDEFIMTVSMGFDKKLLLKFDPIQVLKPQHRVQLNYHVFDGEYDITPGSSKLLISTYAKDDLKVDIRCHNLEDVEFVNTIGFKDKKSYLEKVQSVA